MRPLAFELPAACGLKWGLFQQIGPELSQVGSRGYLPRADREQSLKKLYRNTSKSSVTERTVELFTLNRALVGSRIVLWYRRARFVPYYGFFCHTCNRPFSKTLPPIEHNKGKVVCPRCGSEEGERKWFHLTAAKQGAYTTRQVPTGFDGALLFSKGTPRRML